MVLSVYFFKKHLDFLEKNRKAGNDEMTAKEDLLFSLSTVFYEQTTRAWHHNHKTMWIWEVVKMPINAYFYSFYPKHFKLGQRNEKLSINLII